METFRRLFLVALLAGLVSGVAISAVHQVSTTPLILAAEVYENAGPAETPGAAAEAPAAEGEAGHDHDQAAEGHSHGDGDAWSPADGWERTLSTAVADVLTGVGFSLLLVAAYRIWGGSMTWRTGLFWGLAGFAAIVASPNLGLPPEVPGTEAAPLADRQAWWIATAALTALGLGCIFLVKRAWAAALGLVLIILPHAYGAPQPAEYASAAPEELAHRFIVAATIAGLVFWAILGATTGYFYNRFFKSVAA
jgi:cobalt transporter subunit CbtA